MSFGSTIVGISIKHNKLVIALMIIVALVTGAMIPLIKVDTDPENMLSADEPVRVFHDQTKERFSLSDIVVVGIVNNKDPGGIFNPASLTKVYELTEFAKNELKWPDKDNPERQVGLIEADLLAPSVVDYISQGSSGQVNFEWFMKKPPATQTEALEIRDKARNSPLLTGTIFSEDEKAVCLYLPLTSKDLSYRTYSKLREKIETFEGDEEYYVTGLPVAEDTFGVEMFIQMAISAPTAMVVIFLLMLVFFRKLILVIAPMIVAMISVITTMGLLIGFGFPVHIMSSMIPIFLMPIAVVDSIHILSEFFDLYTKQKGRMKTVKEVMGNLFTPMLYTSLTSAAGFASLALTPIPPVQVFGLFVAAGIMIAWVCTVTFVPAYIMTIKEESLENFGHAAVHEEKANWLTKVLKGTGGFTYSRAKIILSVIAVIVMVAVYGITQIQVNDNPVKWFSKSHPIRQADIELNKHFGGTYMAYLVLEDATEGRIEQGFTDYLKQIWQKKAGELKEQFPDAANAISQAEKLLESEPSQDETREQYLERIIETVNAKLDAAKDTEIDFWYEVTDFFEKEKAALALFKQPQVLEYIAGLQEYLKETGLVGKSNSVTDIVKKVHKELIDGKPENYKVPNSSAAVAQCLIQFQSSHKPNHLWHFVTYDYNKTNLWLQLTSGDNKDMEKVVKAVDDFFASNTPAVPLKYNWAGLTYINTVWQEKMVFGMLQSFLGSFIIVFIMMAVLFRSALWGIICMVPLTITIVLIYGIIGLAGKDYDMPVAVLSALTLGMAVDFAIHFLERARESYNQTGSWKASASVMFGEPARAISRNVLVIAIGFLPLLLAPLVPYKTVGIFLCAIMGLSGVVTLTALPAIIKIAEKALFKVKASPKSMSCNCAFCLIISAAAVVLISINLHQYWKLGWIKMALISVIAIPIMALACGIMSRKKACKNVKTESED
ncbi:MAG: MMPL family transporter [Sedimentisphaerales bacterium]|nr:MMPL family transporter [Sedimentisphaerales bacterium]